MFHTARQQLLSFLSLSIFAAMSTACGDDAASDVDANPPIECATALSERFLPLSIGIAWTYDVTDLSAPGLPTVQKANSVEAYEDIGGKKAGMMAFRLRTEKDNGYTLSWQEDRCTSIVRHREQSFDSTGLMEADQFFMPAKLRVDEGTEHMVPGASWTVSYQEVEVDPVAGETTVSKDETWSVVAVGESVTVPAGTFSALHVRKVTSGDADKQFWFAAGVGKIKEEGEQREELRSFTLP